MPNFEFQKREYYGIMQISKWWKYVFHFVLNVVVVNILVVYDLHVYHMRTGSFSTE